MENAAVLSPQSGLQQHAERRRNGKIKISAKSKSTTVLKLLLLTLLLLTVYAFWSFDYKEIALGEAVASTLHNMKTVFLEPRLSTDTMQNILYQLLVTFCLGILSTVFGAVLAFFCALLCAKNIAASGPANLIKSLVAVVRAVPTVLWVLIFAVSAGLGSVAAVIGLTFHSFAYLTKVYAESIEEVDEGTIEACRVLADRIPGSCAGIHQPYGGMDVHAVRDQLHQCGGNGCSCRCRRHRIPAFHGRQLLLQPP